MPHFQDLYMIFIRILHGKMSGNKIRPLNPCILSKVLGSLISVRKLRQENYGGQETSLFLGNSARLASNGEIYAGAPLTTAVTATCGELFPMQHF